MTQLALVTGIEDFMVANRASGVVAYELKDGEAQYTLADGRVLILNEQDRRDVIPRWDLTKTA